MPLQNVKLSDELLARLGAKTPADTEAAIAAILDNREAGAAETGAMATSIAGIRTAVTDLASQFNTFKTEITGKIPDKAEILREATAKASEIAANAIAKSGTTPVIGAASEEAAAGSKPKNFLELVQAAVKAGKSESKAYSEIIKSNPNEYAAHLKAQGVVK